MVTKAAFTICANNYFAQALTLKKSFEMLNPDVDFYIFIADQPLGEYPSDGVVSLDDSWVPHWKTMAFKYNVIEFSTSIKPFCIEKLFRDYEQILYLDPDMYVLQPLDLIYDYLNLKDIVITPHFCEIETEFTGAVSEEEILFVGIYNLGFLGIRRSDTGKRIVEWWKNRLENKGYADKMDALHVDQKWFDFVPSFFPEETMICHHMGINAAIWNLHEKELIVKESVYEVVNKRTMKTFPLLLFHFSGFNPKNPSIINRRHPNYNVEVFPTFKGLFGDYTSNVLQNGYSDFTDLPYQFNTFKGGYKITPLHRRLFRVYQPTFGDVSDDVSLSQFFEMLRENKLLVGKSVGTSNPNIRNERTAEIKTAKKAMKLLKAVIGIRYYNLILSFFTNFHRLEAQEFLIKNKYK